MSILIKGMEMPTKENVVILINPYGGVWMIGDMPNEDTHLSKAKAVPVPPHGRCIDADALAEHKFVCIPHVTINGKEAGNAYRLGWNSAIEAIMENAETIIGEE